MKAALAKIIEAILKDIEENPEKPHTERGIRKWLSQKGYKKKDIDSAMQLLKPSLTSKREAAIQALRPATRPFTDSELAKLSPAVRDILVRLDVLGLLDPVERELILAKVASSDAIVGLEEFEYILSYLVFNNRDFETQQTVLRVIEHPDQQFH